MLRLIINGQDAVLSKDAEVTLILNSRLLEQKDDDASYPFTLPLDANRHIFGSIDRAGATFNNEYFTTLFFGAYEVLVGFGYVSEIISSSVGFFIRTSGRSLMGMYGNRYLDELDILGYYNYGLTSLISSIARESYLGTLSIVFAPVSDPSRGNETVTGTHRGQINPFDYATGTVYAGAEKIYPFLFIHALLERLFEVTGYSIAYDDTLSIEGFRNLYMICLKEENGYSPSSVGGSFAYTRMLPHITLSAFFDELNRKFNLRFVFDDNRRTVSIRSSAVLITDETVDLTELVSDNQKKVFNEISDVPDNRRFYDKAITIGANADSYDPTLAYLADYMEFNTAENVTDDMKTDEIACISRTVVLSDVNIVFSDGVVLSYNPVYINSLKYVSSDIIIAIFNPLDQDSIRLRYSDFQQYQPPVEDMEAFSPYYRFPDSTVVRDGGLNLLWSDYSDAPGLYTLFWENYFNVIDNLVMTQEIDLVPSSVLIDRIFNLLSINAIVGGCRYLTKKIELTLTIDTVKVCTLELARL